MERPDINETFRSLYAKAKKDSAREQSKSKEKATVASHIAGKIADFSEAAANKGGGTHIPEGFSKRIKSQLENAAAGPSRSKERLVVRAKMRKQAKAGVVNKYSKELFSGITHGRKA